MNPTPTRTTTPGPMVLGHLDRTQLADRVSALLGVAPSPALLDWLWSRTAGLPRLVEHLVGSMRDHGELDSPAPHLEAGIIERLRTDVAALDPSMFRLLLVRALGVAADVAALGHILDLEPSAVADLLRGARASGLVCPDGSIAPLAREALASCARIDPAGGPARRFTARRAEAAALDGDLDEALRLADQVITDPAAADRARAATVVAAVLAHRGLLARSAELYRWTGSAPLAVVALLGTGELDEAGRLLDDRDEIRHRPPTLLAGAESLMARGLHESVIGSPTAALSALTRAATLLGPSGDVALLPDTPAALAGLVALHVGHFDVAESVLDQAVACRLGGPVADPRHRLLQGWTAMFRGDHPLAHAVLLRTTPEDRALEPRDELLAAGLQVGLARREGDLRALHDAWRRAREAIVRHPVDLLALLPLGELAVGAARLRDQGWVAPHLAEARTLLDRLGNPPLWAAPLHWQGVHAAIAAQQPAEATRCAEALATTAEYGPYPAVLAAAGQCWLQVAGGTIGPGTVESAARGLHAAGLPWEGSRLAGQAAIRTTDRKAMSALLALARSLHRGPASPAGGGASSPARGASGPEGSAAASAVGALTEREWEIATLLLGSHTYKQIGERLFISAKTVEHHVARMRQRLGSDGRPELLAQLRVLLDS
ncbi:MAG TPA: helix-turn-helix transcriptional regulator [Pseudonocardiaceae bacterium]